MMIYPRMWVEVSYSSTFIVLWALLLAAMLWRVGQPLQGIAALLLLTVSLSGPHGESRLLFPLLFIGERLLGEMMSLKISLHEFYASTIFSYMTIVYCRTGWRDKGHYIFIRGIRDLVAEIILVTIALRDSGVTISSGVFVVTSFAFFVAMLRILGESEAILVGTLIGFYFFDAFNGNSLIIGGANFSAPVGASIVGTTGQAATTPNSSSGSGKVHIMSRTVLLCSVVLMATLYFTSKFCLTPKFGNSKSTERIMNVPRITAVFWTSLLTLAALAYAIVSMEIDGDALQWLWGYICGSRFRMFTLVYWFVVIPPCVICVDVYARGLSIVVKRKLFHFIAVAAFTPTAIVDPGFLSLSLSVATSIAIIVELVRYYKVQGSSSINGFIINHIDKRDAITGVVRTHIYLIYGLGLSMMFYYRHERHEKVESHSGLLELSISVIPGLVSLGVVDACAGIVGSSFLLSYRRALGRYLSNKVYTERANAPITHKTTTGTLGGLVCGIVFWVFVLIVANATERRESVASLSLVVVCSVAECFTDGIDNLQLPLALYGAVTTLFTLLQWGRHANGDV